MNVLEKQVDDLVKLLESNHFTPETIEKAIKLAKLIPGLFPKIEHGEEGHREWLKEAIIAHFTETPMSEYRAK